MENKINGKSYNGNEILNEYESFIRNAVTNKDMQTKNIQQLDNGEKVVAIQNSIMSNGVYKDEFLKYLKAKEIKPIEIKEEVTVEEGQDDGKLDNVNVDDNTTEGTTKTTKKYPVQRMKNGDIGIVVNGTTYSIKDNKEYFASLNNNELNAVINEATKFGFNTNKMAPRGPQKYLDKKGIRGVKKINPEWQKIEDLNKSLTSVKPKKVTKKKLR